MVVWCPPACCRGHVVAPPRSRGMGAPSLVLVAVWCPLVVVVAVDASPSSLWPCGVPRLSSWPWVPPRSSLWSCGAPPGRRCGHAPLVVVVAVGTLEVVGALPLSLWLCGGPRSSSWSCGAPLLVVVAVWWPPLILKAVGTPLLVLVAVWCLPGRRCRRGCPRRCGCPPCRPCGRGYLLACPCGRVVPPGRCHSRVVRPRWSSWVRTCVVVMVMKRMSCQKRGLHTILGCHMMIRPMDRPHFFLFEDPNFKFRSNDLFGSRNDP